MKVLLLSCLLLSLYSFRETIELPYKNIYEHDLHIIREEINDLYPLLTRCVDDSLFTHKFHTSEMIEEHCIGTHFSIFNHLFKPKNHQLLDIYMKILEYRFRMIPRKFRDDSKFFMELFKMMAKKGYTNLWQTMQVAGRTMHYHISSNKYQFILKWAREAIVEIDDFNKEVLKKKIEFKSYVIDRLERRDRDIKMMMANKLQQEEENKLKKRRRIDRGKTQHKAIKRKKAKTLKTITNQIDDEKKDLMNEMKAGLKALKFKFKRRQEDKSYGDSFELISEPVPDIIKESDTDNFDHNNNEIRDDELEEYIKDIDDTPIKEDELDINEQKDIDNKKQDEIEFGTEDMPVNFNPSDPLNKGNKPNLYIWR